MTETRGSPHIVCPHCHAVNRVDAARIESGPTCGRCKQRLFDGKPTMLDEGSFDKQIARNHIPVVEDLAAGRLVYERAVERGLGTVVDLAT